MSKPRGMCRKPRSRHTRKMKKLFQSRYPHYRNGAKPACYQGKRVAHSSRSWR